MLRPYLYSENEAGCDEAGRGCLAGPVVAAAVILPPHFHHPLLNDSKKTTRKNREMLRLLIEKQAVAWAVGFCSEVEIDQMNILNASILAMHKALDQLSIKPDHILVDGNRFKPYHSIAHTTVVKGDATFQSIAAASILAKTHRDEFMEKLSNSYPQYLWNINKGYPSAAHRDAIREHGISIHHRRSFKLKGQMKLDFGKS